MLPSWLAWLLRLLGISSRAPAAIRNMRVRLWRGSVGGHLVTTATINWTLPTVDVNGDPIQPTDIAKVNIYDAVNGGPANLVGSVPNTPAAPATSFTTPALAGGTHVFTGAAVDVAGDAGPQNTGVSESVPLAPPAALANFTVTLNVPPAAAPVGS
jgi:hypothetical protein